MRLWLGTLRQWHWISSALCLAGMLLFAITGITLNHAARIESKPLVTMQRVSVPEALLSNLPQQGSAALPTALQQWLQSTLAVDLDDYTPEWSKEELYISLPRAGGDAWLSLDTDSGEVEYEITDRGWLAYFNDLHKGRYSCLAWTLFMDAIAVGCVIFSLTGLLLLKRHAGNRPTTWPLISLGLVIPVLLALLLIH